MLPPSSLNRGGVVVIRFNLIHNIVIGLFSDHPLPAKYGGLMIGWLLKLIAIFGFSYAYFVAVERSAHVFAKRIGANFARFARGIG